MNVFRGIDRTQSNARIGEDTGRERLSFLVDKDLGVVKLIALASCKNLEERTEVQLRKSVFTKVALIILSLPRQLVTLSKFLLIVFVFFPARLISPRKRLAVSDKKVLLIANGPSLERDLETVNVCDYDEICMVNAAGNSSLFNRLQPSHYFVQDKFWFSQNEQLSAVARDTGRSINAKLEWRMTICFPGRYPIGDVMLGEIKNENLQYFRLPNDGRLFTFVQLLKQHDLSIATRFERFLQFCIWDLGLNSIHKTGIASTAIFELLIGGARQIDIVGLNMTMANELSLSSKGLQQFRPLHFYGENSEYSGGAEIADFGGGTMAGAYMSIATKFAAFDLMAEYAKRRRCRVTNLSNPTLLDSFPIQN